MSHQLCRSKSDIDRHKNLSEGHNVKLVSGPIFIHNNEVIVGFTGTLNLQNQLGFIYR